MGPVLSIFFSGYFVFIRAFGISVTGFDIGGRVGEIGAIDDGPVAVLFAAEVADEANGVVYVKHIHGGVGIAADHGGEIGGIAQQHEGYAPETDLKQVEVLFYGIADAENEGGGQKDEEGGKTGEEGQAEAINEEDVEGARAFD